MRSLFILLAAGIISMHSGAAHADLKNQQQPRCQPPTKAAVDVLIRQVSNELGADPEVMVRIARIESGLNPCAYNSSGATGLYQFLSGTARQYALVDRFDAEASTRAAIALLSDNARYLRKILGHEAPPALLYMAHQQGVGGVAKLLRNPDKKAAELVGTAAIIQNGGRADWTARQFLQHWIDKFDAVL